MSELLSVAQEIEKMGIIAILALLSLIQGVGLVFMGRIILKSHNNTLKALQGKDVD